MRRPETLKYLFDIAEACSLLDQFVSGKVLADYDVVWGTLETDLPTLRREVATLLAGEGETP